MTYPVVCVWCQKVIGQGAVKGSHGICHSCAIAWLKEDDSCQPPMPLPSTSPAKKPEHS
jgi:hypothetical protein